MKDFSEENVTILNADEDGSHTFQENGSFTFELRDKAGNMGYVTAEVTWIENGDSGKLEIDSEVYHVGDNGIIKNINANTSLEEFLKNINTNAGSIKLEAPKISKQIIPIPQPAKAGVCLSVFSH